jgi:hypothetical protein
MQGIGKLVGGLVIVIGQLAVASPPTALARTPKLGVKDVPRLRRQLRSPKMRVRLDVLKKLWFSPDSEVKVLRALAGLVRRLMKKDPSCRVRAEALRVLIHRRKDIGRNPVRAVLHALADKCPHANARGADWMVPLTTTQRRTAVFRLMRLARRSSFYHVQCCALIALGKLRVKKAEKLMARGLAVGAGTRLSGGGVGYQHSVPTLPQCATLALQYLYGQGGRIGLVALKQKRAAIVQKLKSKSLSKNRRRQLYVDYWRYHVQVLKLTIQSRPPPTVQQVRRWRDRMSRRGYVTASPAALCLSSTSCPKGKSCLHMACVDEARALKVYQTYRKRSRRRRRRARRAWSNNDSALVVRLGLGMGNAGKLANLLYRRSLPPPGAPKLWRTLRNRARRHWLAGQCNKAIGLARQSYQLHPSTLSATLVGYCACSIRDASLARWAYRRTSSITRKSLVRACGRKGIKLP